MDQSAQMSNSLRQTSAPKLPNARQARTTPHIIDHTPSPSSRSRELRQLSASRIQGTPPISTRQHVVVSSRSSTPDIHTTHTTHDRLVHLSPAQSERRISTPAPRSTSYGSTGGDYEANSFENSHTAASVAGTPRSTFFSTNRTLLRQSSSFEPLRDRQPDPQPPNISHSAHHSLDYTRATSEDDILANTPSDTGSRVRYMSPEQEHFPSPSLFQPAVSQVAVDDDDPILNPNDDPALSSYGDGPGLLLLPRRLIIRTLPDTSGMSKKEKKNARNALRVKASDYAPTEQRILQAASTRLIALSACVDPLPMDEQEHLLPEESWRWARESLEKRIDLDKGLLELLKWNLANNRSLVLQIASDAVASHFAFDTNAIDVESQEAADNADQAERLLLKDSFTFADPEERDDPYQQVLFEHVLQKAWFQGSKCAGLTHSELFFPVKTVTLAYLATLLEKSLKEWLTGVHKNIVFTADNHRPRISYFRDEISKSRENPMVKEAGIYESYTRSMEQSTRKRLRVHIKPEPVDDILDNSTEPQGGGLADDDIQRSLQKHRAAQGARARPSTPTALPNRQQAVPRQTALKPANRSGHKAPTADSNTTLELQPTVEQGNFNALGLSLLDGRANTEFGQDCVNPTNADFAQTHSQNTGFGLDNPMLHPFDFVNQNYWDDAANLPV
ncbi:hypothetical protein BDV93DRAFT_506831 [Ceratobasidium sp. AG-I]|nr:hypothetical protein BDV93DRAFT_506831 [Ceratobasidium sp. AG-I]